MSHQANLSEKPDLPVWAQDNDGLIANSDMLAIGAVLLVVIVVKAAARVMGRKQ